MKGKGKERVKKLELKIRTENSSLTQFQKSSKESNGLQEVRGEWKVKSGGSKFFSKE